MLKNYLFLFLLIPLLGGVRGGSSFAQQNMTLLGTLSYTPELSDIWGYVDTAGNEYALVGVNDKVSVVDISNPAIPTEVFAAPGASSIWRDIKTWNNHAYITNESSGGLMIIDLSTLPSNPNLTVTNYTGGGLNKAHNIFIDENGYAYIFGSNIGVGGAVILDLNIDPMVPVQVGVFTDFYLHDGMVRGDTLWGAAINNGFFVVVDVSNKAVPVTITSQNTPHNFAHNCWISDDGSVLFTTDEVSGAFLASYDVSDLGNIAELGRIQSNPGSGVIPHNAHFMNGYIITSYYRDGVTIHDVSRPGNMIEVGNYDTSPLSGNGFNGAWGTYPWLPSGNVLVSDIENGLFVLGATYTRACYLEGTVTDFSTSNPINNATIEILTSSITSSSDINGDYATGILTAGTYNIVFSAAGYIPDTLTAILSNGVLTVLNAQLVELIPFAISGQVVETGSGNPVPNANVKLESNDFLFNLTADGGGNFSIPVFFEGNYEVIAGKWNYVTTCFNQYIDPNTPAILIELDSGIYDDFTFDFGWAVSGTAATGVWERGEPVGTDWIGVGDANPGVDVSTDCSNQAYVTGNAGGGAGNDDVDNGNTVLTSPVFDLSSYVCPTFLNYYRWFFNDGGAGSPNDTLHVKITNGITTVIIESVDASSAGNSSWVSRSFKISDYLTLTATMRVIFETSDLPVSGHLVEAGVDKFEIIIDSTLTVDSTISDLAACGVADGSITIYAGGGTPPLEFSIDTGITFQASKTFNSLAAGIYSIIIRDFLNCTVTILVVVDNTAAPVISVDAVVNISCNGYSNGSIQVSSSGGNPPCQYSLDGGPFQADSLFTGLMSGSYLITVKDASNCISSIQQTLSEPLFALTGILSSTDESSSGANDGTASVSMSGGVIPYAYSWSLGSQTTDSITGLTSDVYTVTVTDANGCTFVDSIVVSTLIGINEFIGENVNIKVYPNPFNESTQIEYKLDGDISTGAKMLITDLLGRFVNEIALTSKQGTITFDDDISEGVYFLKIINGKNFSRTVKLVKF